MSQEQLSRTLQDELGRLNARITRYEQQIARKDGELDRKEIQVDDLSRRLAELVSADNARQVHFQNTRRINDDLRRQKANMERQKANLETQKANLERQLAEITGSRYWRTLTVLHRLRLMVSRALGSG